MRKTIPSPHHHCSIKKLISFVAYAGLYIFCRDFSQPAQLVLLQLENTAVIYVCFIIRFKNVSLKDLQFLYITCNKNVMVHFRVPSSACTNDCA